MNEPDRLTPPAATTPTSARILHVDDDEANRYAVTRSLVRAGFEVIEADTGGAALEKLGEADNGIDLIILDVRLPDIDGFEVCRRLKASKTSATIPVLHLSANFISSEDKAHGLDGGADAYLIRPVAPVELIATVKSLLRVRRAEEQLRAAWDEAQAARAAAEQANRIKDEFLTTLSHELRTPLTAIVGWANILQRGKASPAEHLEGLKTIERNAKVQAKLIEDLLDVGRIISGKLRLEAQRIDLAAAIGAAMEVVQPSVEAKGLHLVADAGSSPLFITADAGRLQQIIGNLLGNAVKFTGEGGEIRVTAARAPDGFIELKIADTGRGIAPDFLPFMFERFRQADVSSRRAQGGLGLGLAIVRQLVELHGGTIRADSRGEGHGSTFTVRLPGADSSTAHLDGAATSPPSCTSPRSASPESREGELLRGFSVLLIEDDADCRSLAARVLEGCGATVIEVDSVAAAFEAISRQRFNAIVSDVGMPVEDGYDFIRKLRQLSAEAGGKTPSLALSAFVQADSHKKMLASGFDAHLGKPVDPRALCEEVAKLVDAVKNAGPISSFTRA